MKQDRSQILKQDYSTESTSTTTSNGNSASNFATYKPLSGSSYSNGSGRSHGHGDEMTVFSNDAELKGTLSFATKLEFNGRFEGEMHAEGPLVIGEKAVIKGHIHSSAPVVIYGKMKGNIITTDRIELKDQAQLYGDVKAARLIVAEGATFVGRSDTPEGNKPEADFGNIFTRIPQKSND